MSISGNLKTMELSELLQWLAQSSKTGTLVIDSGHVEKKIFFSKGRLVSSASSDPKEYLGHFLVSHGYITEHELAKAMEMQNSNKMLLGKILVTIGLISADDLHGMLRLKSEESIYDIFSWEAGEFRFWEQELPSHEMVPISLDVTTLVFNGMQRLDEWGRIRKHIPSSQTIPVLTGALTPANEHEERILALVNDERTVEEIALETHASEYQVCRALLEQIETGAIKAIRPRTVGSSQGPAAGAALAHAWVLVERSRELMGARSFEAALRHLRAARSLEPDNRKILSAFDKGTEEIRRQVEADGVVPGAVPSLDPTVEEISALEITPQEGFILSRINGRYDVQTILKISPMPALDAQVVLWKLLQAGHIQLDAP